MFFYVVLSLSALLSTPLRAQEGTQDLLWTKAVIREYHDALFNLAATSIDYTMPSLHNFSGAETTSRGWAFKNFRLRFGVGYKISWGILNLENTYQVLNNSLDLINVNSFIERIIPQLEASGPSYRTTLDTLITYVPFFSFSFGRLGNKRRQSALEDLLFTIQYGTTLSSLSFDETIGAPLQLSQSTSINIFNIAFQYAFYETRITQFQALAAFGYNRTLFSGSFLEINNSAVFSPDTSGEQYTITDEGSTTYINHTLYSLQLGARGEINISHFVVFFQLKLLFKLYNNLFGYSDVEYTVEGNGQSIIDERFIHHYQQQSSIVPSFLFGVSFFKILNLSFDFSLFQSSTFVNYFSFAVSIDVPL